MATKDEEWNAFLDAYQSLKLENEFLLEKLKEYYDKSSSDSEPGDESKPREQEGV